MQSVRVLIGSVQLCSVVWVSRISWEEWILRFGGNYIFPGPAEFPHAASRLRFLVHGDNNYGPR